MDDLTRFSQALVGQLQQKAPDALTVPLPLLDIPGRIFPYAQARRELGIECHEDYEMLLLRLAAGEGGYAATIPNDVADRFREEISAAVPETTLYRAFPEAQIVLSIDKVERAVGGVSSKPSSATPVDGVACETCGAVSSTVWEFCPRCGAQLEHDIPQYRVAIIPGDGIGPEVVDASLPVLAAVAAEHGFACEWTTMPYSADHYLKTGETLPDDAFQRLAEQADAIFLGAMGDPRVPDNIHARDILLGLRLRLDLYINFRPIRLLHPSLSPLKGYDGGERTIDFVIFRENTEGQYVGRGRVEDETHIAEEIATPAGVERIVRAAFSWADEHGRKRVTMSDKANAIAQHELWQRTFRAVAEEYPHLDADHRYVDALALELVRQPDEFDVVVTNNLYGDILSDLGAGLVGGLGLAPSANLHPGRPGLFEPVHGSAPAMAGQGTANPLAAILTGGLMFDALGQRDAAARVENAVTGALAAGLRTRDLGGTASTQDATNAVLDHLA